MDYTWLFFGVFGGLLFGMIFAGLGYIAGRSEDGVDKGHNQGELPTDDTSGDLLHVRSRRRSGDNGCDIQVSWEEIAVVLFLIRHTFDKNLSRHEIECLEAAYEMFDRDPPDGSHSLRDKILVLNTLRNSAGWYEKDMIDEITGDLIKLDSITD